MSKCEHCNAPVDKTEDGRIRFDSSQYHMATAKHLSEISMWKGYATDLEAAMQEFVDRFPHSGLTHQGFYEKFKALISDDSEEPSFRA